MRRVSYLDACVIIKGVKSDGILHVYQSVELRERFSKNSVALARKYDLKSIRLKMAKIYDEVESWGRS